MLHYCLTHWGFFFVSENSKCFKILSSFITKYNRIDYNLSSSSQPFKCEGNYQDSSEIYNFCLLGIFHFLSLMMQLSLFYHYIIKYNNNYVELFVFLKGTHLLGCFPQNDKDKKWSTMESTDIFLSLVYSVKYSARYWPCNKIIKIITIIISVSAIVACASMVIDVLYILTLLNLSTTLWDSYCIIFPISQKRKLRHTEVK